MSGLTISNSLAKRLSFQNKGIMVESELGKGSKFSFEIVDFSFLNNLYSSTIAQFY